MTQIAVLGAGAVGSMIGGLIAAHDPSVELRLWARGEHARQMRTQGGVTLLGPWGTKHAAARVCEDPKDLRGSDLVLLTVKSQDTAATLEAAAGEFGAAPVVSLQNGINQHVMERYLQPQQLLVGMTATNMAIPKPGTVSLQRDGITVVGSVADPSPTAMIERVIALLRLSTLKMQSQRNIIGVQYNKVAMNTIGYTSVLSRSHFLRDCILDRQWRQQIAEPMLDECFATYKAAGIHLETVPGPSDVRRFRRLLHQLDRPCLGVLYGWGVRHAARQRIVYSVEQDLMRGRPTEIDYVNGQIVRLAAEHGCEAPLNKKVVDLVHQLESEPSPTFLSRERVIRELTG